MELIEMEIDFLHNARPYLNSGVYTNIVVSFPLGALPNEGDIIRLENIKHPKGDFIVCGRKIDVRQGALHVYTLILGIQGIHS